MSGVVIPDTPAYEYRVVCDAGGTAPATNASDVCVVARLLDEAHPDHGPHRPERRRLYTNTWEPVPEGQA